MTTNTLSININWHPCLDRFLTEAENAKGMIGKWVTGGTEKINFASLVLPPDEDYQAKMEMLKTAIWKVRISFGGSVNCPKEGLVSAANLTIIHFEEADPKVEEAELYRMLGYTIHAP